MKAMLLSCLCWLLLACGELDAQFPAELVDFIPYPEGPQFSGRGRGHWDVAMRERAWILREDDGYHMWYGGYDPDGSERLYMGYATSADGLRWRRFSDGPIHDTSWIEDVTVVQHEGTYYMFSEGEGDRAHLLESRDRVHWTERGPLDVRARDGSPLPEGPLGTPAVLLEGGLWHLFYERQDLGIYLATSRDLQVWTNVQDEPVLTLGPGSYDSLLVAMNQVVRYQGRYYAYYNGMGRGPDWSTMIAVSDDLRSWRKYARPLLPPEQFKNSSFLVHDGAGLRLYSTHTRVQAHRSR